MTHLSYLSKQDMKINDTAISDRSNEIKQVRLIRAYINPRVSEAKSDRSVYIYTPDIEA